MKPSKSLLSVPVTALLLAMAAPASAALVDWTRDPSNFNVREREAPRDFTQDAMQSNNTVQLLIESADVALAEALTINLDDTGTTTELAAGTVVSSYLFHTDPRPSAPSARTYVGTLTFDAPILGFIADAPGLSATDILLGSPLNQYEPSRALGSLGNNDQVSFVGSVLTFSIRTGVNGLDEFRIITEGELAEVIPTPVPPAMLLFVSALGVLAVRYRAAA